MRKIALITFLMCTLIAFGQAQSSSIGMEDATFYGVDFSLVQVYGASETPHQFKNAFYGINTLFLTEPKKYDVSSLLNMNVNHLSLDEVNINNDNIQNSELLTYDVNYQLSKEELQEAVNSFPVDTEDGLGIIIFAELLDKVHAKGYYHIVIFNKENKNIVYSQYTEGRAQGFGLRNYWARSVLNAMRRN